MPAMMRGGVHRRGDLSFIVLAIVAFLAIGLKAPSAKAHPNGGAGHGRAWKPQWTQYFNDCFAQYGQPLAKARPADKRVYCSNTNPSLSETDYWLSIYIPIARAESGFNAHAIGRNGRKTPLGLFQMSADDMNRYNCDGTNPSDPRQSICCAIKIGSYWADYWGARGEQRISNGKQGILASFFQPIRTGVGGDGRGGHINDSRKHKTIVASSNRLCQYAPATGRPELGASGGLFSCSEPVESTAELRFTPLADNI